MKQLIILPGWGGTKETWNDFIKIAEKDYKVICLNLPCFGNEPCPGTVWGVKEYAEFVKNKIKKLNLEKPILLGHSFGGQIAVYLAAYHPELIFKLILSGATVTRPKNILKRIVFNIIAKCGKVVFKLPIIKKIDVFAKKILYYSADSPDYIKTSGIKQDIFKKIIRQDLTHLLYKINIPTLVVWGTRDKYVALNNGKKIAKLIPNAKLEIIKNGKHGLHIQQPENLFEIIKEFDNITKVWHTLT